MFDLMVWRIGVVVVEKKLMDGSGGWTDLLKGSVVAKVMKTMYLLLCLRLCEEIDEEALGYRIISILMNEVGVNGMAEFKQKERLAGEHMGIGVASIDLISELVWWH
ncbi:unnamed protein product [Anisakis simplex]|uniref:Transmembrane protein n=1 Tax=Anisakis simplex TaxID=6269 RepID=A0A0M3JYW6_ANISI|nr:unnamed protein product [Anisakis simplex]